MRAAGRTCNHDSPESIRHFSPSKFLRAFRNRICSTLSLRNRAAGEPRSGFFDFECLATSRAAFPYIRNGHFFSQSACAFSFARPTLSCVLRSENDKRSGYLNTSVVP